MKNGKMVYLAGTGELDSPMVCEADKKIVNLTPHTVCVGGIEIPPEGGEIPRVTFTEREVSRLRVGDAVIPVKIRERGAVTGLPEQRKDTILIVSSMVQSVCPDRGDLFVPGDFTRDDAGRITGAGCLFCSSEGVPLTLREAVRKGKVEEVERLLEAGADPNVRDQDKWSPLQWATRFENIPIIRLLLNAGADPNIQDGNGLTPLHWAGIHGYEDVARLLLDAGADPDVKDRSGETPLQIARYYNNSNIVKLFGEAVT